MDAATDPLKWETTGLRAMPGASRVQLVPPNVWGEAQLVAAARALPAIQTPVRPGDAVGELVVARVEPAPGATILDKTELEIVPTPPRPDALRVDLAILVDVSESMGLPWDAKHTRLEAARVALAAFLASPGAAVETAAVFEYAKQPRLVAGPASPGDLTLGGAPRTKGPSATASALNGALEHLAARLPEARAQSIILLTDGVGDVADLLVAAGRAGRLHVPVHSLVFAPEVDDVFQEIAHASGGSFQRASHPLTIEFEHEPQEAHG